MPRYIAHFVEEVHYEIEFDCDEQLLDRTGKLKEHADDYERDEIGRIGRWFQLLDDNAADWLKQGQVMERKLTEMHFAPLRCSARPSCRETVTHIDALGYRLCAKHAATEQKKAEGVRKLTAREIRTIQHSGRGAMPLPKPPAKVPGKPAERPHFSVIIANANIKEMRRQCGY